MSELDFEAQSDIEISFVVPAYNEQSRLPKMLSETLDFILKQKLNYEIVVVSDGSFDKTVDTALAFHQYKGNNINLKVVEYKINKGKGGAVRYGMMVAQGRYILMLDADAATSIEDFTHIFNSMKQTEKNSQGIVVGSRSHYFKEVKKERKWYRNILQYISHFVISVICGIKVSDTQCGFKLFAKSSAKKIFNVLHLQRWSFDVEIFMIANQLCVPVSEVPVNWQEIEGSKLNVILAPITMMRDFLLVKLLYLLKIWKITDILLNCKNIKTKQD